MCTVTWWRDAGHYEVFFNRDERKTRGVEQPPAIREASSRLVSALDSDSGGTWLAVNGRGLTCGVLNHYVADRKLGALTGPLSRGRLPRMVLAMDDPSQEAFHLGGALLARLRPFHLLVWRPDGNDFRATWDGVELKLGALDMSDRPQTTSSFQSVKVCNARREAFQSLGAEIDRKTLRAYHFTTAEDGAYGVRMNRPDAQSMSFSHIIVTPGTVTYRYEPHPREGLALGEPSEIQLSRLT